MVKTYSIGRHYKLCKCVIEQKQIHAIPSVGVGWEGVSSIVCPHGLNVI